MQHFRINCGCHKSIKHSGLLLNFILGTFKNKIMLIIMIDYHFFVIIMLLLCEHIIFVGFYAVIILFY